MPAKTPIYLKTPTDRKGRRPRLRDVLSGDMISPPLGDVRHSAHVGPQGPDDMFGDVAFLQGQMDVLPSLRGPHSGHQDHHRGHQDHHSGHQGPHSGHQGPHRGHQGPHSGHQNHHSQNHHSQGPHSGHQDPYSRHQTSFPDPMDILPSLRAAHSVQEPSPRGPSVPPPLWSSSSLPLLIAQEQAPPKPPRLHLDPPPPLGPAPSSHLDPPPPLGPARWAVSLSSTIQQLVPSSGSSSEDSLFGACGPLGVPRGLSLDSDAALSNEDLRSEGSSSSPPRTDSVLASLDLDLGPSIMDDVLSIMDRYRGPSPSPGP